MNKDKNYIEELENVKSFEDLYNSTLVVSSEFQRRDEENQEIKCELEEKIQKKDKVISELREQVNTYKIREHELEKKEEKIEEIKEKAIKQTKKDVGNKIKARINELRGHITKSVLNNEIDVVLREKIEESEE